MLLPSYTSIFLIYAFCNMDKVSSRTRDEADTHINVNRELTNKFQTYRSRFLMGWILLNLLFIFCLTSLSLSIDIWYLAVVSVLLCSMVVLKLLTSFYYVVK